MRRYPAVDVLRSGAAKAAETALERVHVASHEFVLHFDVDVISSEDFPATNYAAPGGLRLDDVRRALEVFARQKNLGAFEVTVYNPALDSDGSAAKKLVELIAGVLAHRLEALSAPEPAVSPSAELATNAAAASAAMANSSATPMTTLAPVEPAPPPVSEEDPVSSSESAVDSAADAPEPESPISE